MGLSSKQVSGDHQGIDWGQTLPGAAAELPKPPSIRRQQPLQQQSEPLKCPRCGSTNTKFCYYNNYNKSQPRHFCKSCKRHWTKGGTLRNVPVGGGRKNKRPKISNAATTTAGASATAAASNTGNNPKSVCNNILYQALFRSSSTLSHETKEMESPDMNNLSATQIDQNTEPQFSSFKTSVNDLDQALIVNPTSYQSINAFDHPYTGNLDSIEESTITTVDIPGTSSGPWPGPDTAGALELPNYWNWNEIDELPSADLNIAWDDQLDDAEIKP